MLRLTGILIGSALAIGLLILMLGVPQFADPDPEPSPVGASLAANEPNPVPDPEPVGASLLANEPTPVPDPEPVGASLLAKEPEPEPEPDTEALIEQIFSPDPVAELPVEDNWYAFWSPFRSELAANGFVSKLQETTGIDYRVVKVKTGVYEVAFAYTDDADVQDKLARISAATGLDMSGG